MPPLERGLSRYEQPPTDEQLEQQRTLRAKSQEVYGAMQEAVPLERTTRRHLLDFTELRRPAKTLAATYPLPGEPPFRQMRAWMERNPTTNGVTLKTQVFETFNGRVARVEPTADRCLAESGELYDWAPDDYTFDQRMQLLEDIQATVDVIKQANLSAKATFPAKSTSRPQGSS